MKIKYVAIIPARGGSKRLPKKNIMCLNGIPLIVYSINYALENGINDIYVSTDDMDIADVAKKHGANVIMRPSEISGDHTPTSDVLKHATIFLKQMEIDFNYFILLQPTNPLRPKNLLTDSLSIIEKNNKNSLFTVSCINKKLGEIEDTFFKPYNYKFGERSQDMKKIYSENGLLYITCKKMIEKGLIMDDESYPMIVDHIFGEVDIDTIRDFKLAEYIINEKIDI